MKQYLTPDQTAKLIRLGFKHPKSYTSEASFLGCGFTYSIGELLSFLPNDGVSDKRLEFDGFYWYVDWDSFDKIHQTDGVDLVDALYDMCVKLKEEGVI